LDELIEQYRGKYDYDCIVPYSGGKDSTYLYNKIRMLEYPYPNAYIKTIDGKKILIKLAELND
jgi:tRNA(Ile)-lysidine synthase TilS/MesJ